jgi:SOS-response transcriptional repressor LexA
VIEERNGRRKTKVGDKLTARQEEVLAAILGLQRRHGIPPTIREIGHAVGISNTNAVACHLRALVAKGSIRRVMENSARIYLPVVPEHCCPTCGRRLDAKEDG